MSAAIRVDESSVLLLHLKKPLVHELGGRRMGGRGGDFKLLGSKNGVA